MSSQDALALARAAMRLLRLPPDEAVASQPLIPEAMRPSVVAALQAELDADQTISIRDLRMLEEDGGAHRDWLRHVDRQAWFYWPRLRDYLLNRKHWSSAAVDSIDEVTDRILGAMEDPQADQSFDTRGIVVGFVQSGKTANYTALIAKAADTGYRLFIVLAGVHNQLRQQTQRRLNSELVGTEPVGVPHPTEGRRRWLTFTTTDLAGDFSPGTVDTAALSGEQPALIVAKKNASVLRRLNSWLEDIPPATRRELPVLVIDDEADQASPNTRGNRPFPNEDDDTDEPDVSVRDSPPSIINGRIRTLLSGFQRSAYVGYTATPFANVLIDHRAEDRYAGADLYPKSFIVDLPEPSDYFGAERIFGSPEDSESRGMDVIRHVSDDDVDDLVPHSRDEVLGFEPDLPRSLRDAIDDFVLAGAARFERGDGAEPATMLIHTSHYQIVQDRLHARIERHMVEFRNEWRYNWNQGLEDRLRQRWETDFRRVTRAEDLERDRPFDAVRQYIGPMLEPLRVLQLNSRSEDELDYVREPSLKAVVVGGNRLSRGLTLEGLLVSYYVRRANAYDTLMQMGRWFGYRDRYADLTRVYTTVELERWFRDLVTVEQEVRQDIRRYAEMGMTPLDFGPRIRRHSALLVTDRLKMRAAREERLSFANELVQTVRFPFDDRDWLQTNLDATTEFIEQLGSPDEGLDRGHPAWMDVEYRTVLNFLASYAVDPSNVRINWPLLQDFLRKQAEDHGEFVTWVVGIMGQANEVPALGRLPMGIPGNDMVNLIQRTRLADQNSLGVITSPSDQGIGLTREEFDRARPPSGGAPSGRKLREVRGEVRDRREAALLIYPISRMSGWDGDRNVAAEDSREPIYDDPAHARDMVDIIGVALSLPPSDTAATVEYVVGTVGGAVD